MKLRNITSLPVQMFDEHAGKGAVVEPGGETPELSELAALELQSHAAVWAPVGDAEAVEKPAVRTSGRSAKKES